MTQTKACECPDSGHLDTCPGHPDWCYGHNAVEPIPEGVIPYLCCFECKHAYLTEAELVAEHNKIVTEMNEYSARHELPNPVIPLVTSAEFIYTCPLCIHDF
jgi:hypothetical protein